MCAAAVWIFLTGTLFCSAKAGLRNSAPAVWRYRAAHEQHFQHRTKRLDNAPGTVSGHLTNLFRVPTRSIADALRTTVVMHGCKGRVLGDTHVGQTTHAIRSKMNSAKLSFLQLES